MLPSLLEYPRSLCNNIASSLVTRKELLVPPKGPSSRRQISASAPSKLTPCGPWTLDCIYSDSLSAPSTDATTATTEHYCTEGEIYRNIWRPEHDIRLHLQTKENEQSISGVPVIFPRIGKPFDVVWRQSCASLGMEEDTEAHAGFHKEIQ